MSINGHFREIRPSLLRQIQEDPSLTRTIILGSMAPNPGLEAARMHFEGQQAPYPTRENEALTAALDNMSPAQRKIAMFAVTKISDFFRKAYSQVGDISSLEPGSLGEHLSLGKAWHGIHFLLCGESEPTSTPLGQAILGGIEIGEDTGYGPPRYLDSGAVGTIAKALSAFDEAELRRRYDGNAMNAADLYPDDWNDPENLDWLVQEFDRVRGFYSRTAGRGNAALLYHI